MKKVLVSDTLAKEGIAIFKKAKRIKVDVITNLTHDELKAIIKEYDALAIRSATRVTKDIINAAAKLKVIGRAGIGLDNVDVEAASIRGIVVMNTPGGNTNTTAEHTIAMMLSLARKVPQATQSMKKGKWEKNKFMGAEIYNKTLGIIGTGRVGSIVAGRAQGLKMHVIAYDPFISPEAAEKLGINLVSFEELLSRSDFISVHTPLTDETKNIINASTIKKMKAGVFIINCARGGIVNEKDLHDALVAGKVAGAALDVFEEEPTANKDLVSLENVICTPHLGASTEEAQRNVAIAVAEQMVDYLTTGEIKNAANFPSVSTETLGLIRPYLALAEKLGIFQAQIVSGAIKEVAVEFSGEIVSFDVTPITIALLKGLLTPILKESVNYINAPVLAKERGIRVIESKSSEAQDYISMISVQVKTSTDRSSTAGAIFGRRDPRIVRVDKFPLDIIPEGHMVMIYNNDKPGVIGNIGTTLGASGINIARLHLGREQIDGKALVVLSTDSMLNGEAQRKLKELPHVISIRKIEM